jgi:23S rRNA pseudouridine1911/1915/1917 synthase
MLHAKRLGFQHPESGRFIEFETDLPDDFREMLASLKEAGSQPIEEKT